MFFFIASSIALDLSPRNFFTFFRFRLLRQYMINANTVLAAALMAPIH